MADTDPLTKKGLIDFEARIGAKLDAKIGSEIDGFETWLRKIFAKFVREVNAEFLRALDHLETGIPVERSSSSGTIIGNR